MAAAAVFVSLHKSLGEDESFTLATTGQSLGHAFKQALDFELQPPFYFVLANFWRQLASSLEWLRLLSTLFALGAVCYADRLTRMLGVSPAWRGAWLAAACPALLWAATEIRVYALAALLVTATLYYFARVWIAGSARPGRDAALFVVCAYLAVLTQYYTGFVLAAVFLTALLLGPERKRLLLCGLALALLMAPWIPTILHQAGTHPTYLPPVVLARETWIGTALATLRWSGRQVFSSFLDPGLDLTAGRILPAVTLAFGLFTAAAVPWRQWNRTDITLSLIAILPLATLLVLSGTGAVLVERRHWIGVVPGTLAWLAWMGGRAPAGWRARIAGLALAAPFAAGAGRFVLEYRGPVDWKSAAAYLAAHEEKGEGVALYLFEYGPFAHYYHGGNRTLRILRRPGPSSRVAELTAETKGALRRYAAESPLGEPRLWIVHSDRLKPDLVKAAFEAALGRRLIVRDLAQFAGVLLLRTAPEGAQHPRDPR